MTELKRAEDVKTAPLMVVGLAGGFAVAQQSGVRPLGGAVLLGSGLLAGRTWLAKRGPVTAAGLTAVYLGGFIASHKLAKKIGAWPSVAVVTAASAAAAYCASDRH